MSLTLVDSINISEWNTKKIINLLLILNLEDYMKERVHLT